MKVVIAMVFCLVEVTFAAHDSVMRGSRYVV